MSLLLLVAVAGCKPPTPGEQLDTIHSWLGTADMAAQAWVNHTAPEKYTRQTLELARETIETTADQLLQSPPPGLDTAALRHFLMASDDRIAQMARFVQSRNAPAVSAQLDTLRAEARTVGQMADRAKAAE